MLVSVSVSCLLGRNTCLVACFDSNIVLVVIMHLMMSKSASLMSKARLCLNVLIWWYMC
jgi:uncharacterized membrane protein